MRPSVPAAAVVFVPALAFVVGVAFAACAPEEKCRISPFYAAPIEVGLCVVDEPAVVSVNGPVKPVPTCDYPTPDERPATESVSVADPDNLDVPATFEDAEVVTVVSFTPTKLGTYFVRARRAENGNNAFGLTTAAARLKLGEPVFIPRPCGRVHVLGAGVLCDTLYLDSAGEGFAFAAPVPGERQAIWDVVAVPDGGAVVTRRAATDAGLILAPGTLSIAGPLRFAVADDDSLHGFIGGTLHSIRTEPDGGLSLRTFGGFQIPENRWPPQPSEVALLTAAGRLYLGEGSTDGGFTFRTCELTDGQRTRCLAEDGRLEGRTRTGAYLIHPITKVMTHVSVGDAGLTRDWLQLPSGVIQHLDDPEDPPLGFVPKLRPVVPTTSDAGFHLQRFDDDHLPVVGVGDGTLWMHADGGTELYRR